MASLEQYTAIVEDAANIEQSMTAEEMAALIAVYGHFIFEQGLELELEEFMSDHMVSVETQQFDAPPKYLFEE